MGTAACRSRARPPRGAGAAPARGGPRASLTPMSESPTPPRSGPTRRASPDARRVAVPGSLAAAMPGLGAGRLVVWHGSPAEAAGVATATGAVLWHRDPAALCAELLELCPELDWVHSLWTGLGHLPLDALLRRRITVTTGRGVPAGPLAEWVLAALLWSAKRLEAATAAWRAGEWPEIDVDELAGCRIVVLGTGSIGRAVAVRAAALGVAVTGVARRPRRLAGFGDVLPGSELARACRGAAALVVAVLVGRLAGPAAAALLAGGDPPGAGVRAAGAVLVGVLAGVLEPAVQAQVGGTRRPLLEAGHRRRLVHGVLGHLAVGGPLAAGDGDQPRGRDGQGVVAGQRRRVLALALGH